MYKSPSLSEHWLGIAVTGATLCPLVPHAQACLATGNWVFLIVGLTLPLIGVFHGLGVWLGVA
jgi:hypothetical protein